MSKLVIVLGIFVAFLAAELNAVDLNERANHYLSLDATEAKKQSTNRLDNVEGELKHWKTQIKKIIKGFETDMHLKDKMDKISEFRTNMINNKFTLKKVYKEIPDWYKLQHEVQTMKFYKALLKTMIEEIEEQLVEVSFGFVFGGKMTLDGYSSSFAKTGIKSSVSWSSNL